MKLGNSDQVRKGQSIAFTGFPLGGALGFSPVIHRGIESSVIPIALPSGNAQQINEKLIRKIRSGTFNILQLDATAYPSNCGSPVYDTETVETLGVINMVFIKGTREAALSQPSGISYADPGQLSPGDAKNRKISVAQPKQTYNCPSYFADQRLAF